MYAVRTYVLSSHLGYWPSAWRVTCLICIWNSDTTGDRGRLDAFSCAPHRTDDNEFKPLKGLVVIIFAWIHCYVLYKHPMLGSLVPKYLGSTQPPLKLYHLHRSPIWRWVIEIRKWFSISWSIHLFWRTSICSEIGAMEMICLLARVCSLGISVRWSL